MTIFALSSAPGQSGVAVIRISGPETGNIIKSITNKDYPDLWIDFRLASFYAIKKNQFKTHF